MRKTTQWMILGVLVGCAAQTDTGRTGGALSAVDLQALTSEIHYLAPQIAAEPLTLEAIGDPSEGVAVGLAVHDHFLVAWAAPHGLPRIGDPDSVMAAWRIEAPSNIQATSDDVVTDESGSTVHEQGEPRVDLDPAYRPLLSGDLIRAPQIEGGPSIHVNWWFDDPGEWLLWWSGHPGCI